MKNDKKAIIAGAGAVLAYFLMKKNKEKKRMVSVLYLGQPNRTTPLSHFENSGISF